MKKYVKGQYIEMTEEEVAAMQAEMPAEQPPTYDERLAALESAMLAQILGGAVNV
jgi:hypothetical protein